MLSTSTSKRTREDEGHEKESSPGSNLDVSELRHPLLIGSHLAEPIQPVDAQASAPNPFLRLDTLDLASSLSSWTSADDSLIGFNDTHGQVPANIPLGGSANNHPFEGPPVDEGVVLRASNTDPFLDEGEYSVFWYGAPVADQGLASSSDDLHDERYAFNRIGLK